MIKTVFHKYFTIIKYGISAGISFLVDIAIFSLFVNLLKKHFTRYILIATIIARIISSFFNYLMNKNVVFTSNNKKLDIKSFLKYYILVVIVMFTSATLVSYIYKITELNEIYIKVPVDIILFITNYIIQKKYIFIRGESEDEK